MNLVPRLGAPVLWSAGAHIAALAAGWLVAGSPLVTSSDPSPPPGVVTVHLVSGLAPRVVPAVPQDDPVTETPPSLSSATPRQRVTARPSGAVNRTGPDVTPQQVVALAASDRAKSPGVLPIQEGALPPELAVPASPQALGVDAAGHDANAGGDVPAPSTAPSGPARAEPVTEVPPLYALDYLANPKPVYPLAARRRGAQGRVLVRVAVDALGRAGEVRIEQSSGDRALDEAALRAVRAWRFEPARRGRQAIAATALVPIQFQLDG